MPSPHTDPIEHQPTRPAGARVLLAIGVALVGIAVLPGVAAAHAVLLSLTPDSGELLQEPPPEIELQFNEPVSIASDAIVVLDPSGQRIGGLEAVADDAVVRAALPELTEDGSYTVGWKVVSGDGHPLRGAYLFHLRDQTLSEPITLDGTDTSVAVDVLRAVGSAMALFALIVAGGTLLARRSWRSRPAMAGVWTWNVAAVGTLLVLAAAVMAVGSSFGESLSVVLDTSSGRVALSAWVLSLLGVVLAAARVPDRVMAVVVVATAVAIGLGGHAVSLPPLALSATLTVAHVLAAIVWIIGLVWLVRRLGTDAGDSGSGPVDEIGSVAALSPYALGSVLVLGLSGVVLVLDRVPLDELTTSTYGVISLVKLLLLTVAVVLAVLNRFRFAPALANDEVPDDGPSPGAPAARLRRSVGIEVIVLSFALIAGTALAQVSPPSAAAAEPAPTLDRQPFGDGQVELTVEPGSRGTNELHVIAFGDDGRLMDVEELTVEMTLPAEDLGPLLPEMTEITNGHVTSYAEFPLAGTWEVEVIGRLNRFESLESTFEVEIAP